MSILPGFKKYKKYIKLINGYQLCSLWSDASSIKINNQTLDTYIDTELSKVNTNTQTAIDTASAARTDISTARTELEADIATVQRNVDSNKTAAVTAVNAANTKIGENTSAITAMGNRVTQNANGIAACNTAIAGVSGKVDENGIFLGQRVINNFELLDGTTTYDSGITLTPGFYLMVLNGSVGDFAGIDTDVVTMQMRFRYTLVSTGESSDDKKYWFTMTGGSGSSWSLVCAQECADTYTVQIILSAYPYQKIQTVDFNFTAVQLHKF